MKTTLKIEGMSCGHCVRYVTETLEGIEGVKSALVSLEDKTAIVEHDEGASIDDMKNAVADSGYDVN